MSPPSTSPPAGHGNGGHQNGAPKERHLFEMSKLNALRRSGVIAMACSRRRRRWRASRAACNNRPAKSRVSKGTLSNGDNRQADADETSRRADNWRQSAACSGISKWLNTSSIFSIVAARRSWRDIGERSMWRVARISGECASSSARHLDIS